MKKNNRHVSAFKEGFNMIGLAGAAALSAVTLNPLPFLIGLAAEAVYLIFVPDSRWYMDRLERRSDAEVIARRATLTAQVFPYLSRPMQNRFERLEGIRTQLGTQPDLNNQAWFRQVVRKLDYLLEKFLMLASKAAEFRTYLQTVQEEIRTAQGQLNQKKSDREDEERVIVHERRSSYIGRSDSGENKVKRDAGNWILNIEWVAKTVQTIQEHYTSEVAEVDERLGDEEDRNTRAVLEKRVDVLNQRREYVGKIGNILTNLCHQMDLLEDSFGLINDQVRARPPEQVLAEIEGVVYQTESMTKLLEELAPFNTTNTTS